VQETRLWLFRFKPERGKVLAATASSQLEACRVVPCAMCQLHSHAAQHAQNMGGKIAAPKIAIIGWPTDLIFLRPNSLVARGNWIHELATH